MTGTIINLEPEDKASLDQRAAQEQVPMTEIVRRAIKTYRLQLEAQGGPGLQALREQTRGIWSAGEGLAYQQNLRAEWPANP